LLDSVPAVVDPRDLVPVARGDVPYFAVAPIDADGYNYVKIFDPTGGRNYSRAYSRQYEYPSTDVSVRRDTTV